MATAKITAADRAQLLTLIESLRQSERLLRTFRDHIDRKRETDQVIQYLRRMIWKFEGIEERLPRTRAELLD